MKKEDKKLIKTHFGPEETEEYMYKKALIRSNQQKMLGQELKNQINVIA